jgi:hypothetical protein
MTLIGQRLSSTGKLHLLKNQEQDTWVTCCGRKVRAQYAVPKEDFDFTGADCCICCVYKYSLNQQKTSKSSTLAAF